MSARRYILLPLNKNIYFVNITANVNPFGDLYSAISRETQGKKKTDFVGSETLINFIKSFLKRNNTKI